MMRIKLEDAFDPSPAQAQPAMRPRDAATLILVRGGREVMMGQRAKGAVFFPDKWVFPGGRLDPGDARLPAARELTSQTEALLRLGGVRRAPRAFALAAARETREETGLALGGAGGPDISHFSLVCRAVTPPGRVRRFDARFFLADAEAVLADDTPTAGDAELLHTRWFALEQAEKLDLPSITRFVLGEVRARLGGQALAPPFLRWRGGGHYMERLELPS